MADSSAPNSWWGGWLHTVKEQSICAYEQVKKDLDEYTHTVYSDTFSAVNSTSVTLKDTFQNENSRLNKGLNAFIGELSSVVSAKDEGRVRGIGSEVVFDRAKARLHTVQIDPATYIDPPNTEQYNIWADSFNPDLHKGEISELLVTNAQVRSLYTQMVPSDLSHGVFWRRYFYRIHQLQLEDARKQALMSRAERSHDDSYSWDDDDEESFVDVQVEMRGTPAQEQMERIPTLPEDRPQQQTPGTDACAQHSILNNAGDSVCIRDPRSSVHGDTPRGPTLEAVHTTDPPGLDVRRGDGPVDPRGTSDCVVTSDTRDGAAECTDEVDVGETRVAGVRGVVCTEVIETGETRVAGVNDEVCIEETNVGDAKGAGVSDLVCTEGTEVGEARGAGVSDAVEIREKVKGDMVVVGGSSSSSPMSDGNKGSSGSGADDDWGDDLDLEVTEEDIKAAEEVAKQLTAAGIATDGDEDDWNWD